VRWIALSFALPSGSPSSRRVALWRRLRQIGAVAPTGALYLLPAGAESQEAFEWLAQEIQEGGGEALVLPIESLEPAAEGRVVELFRTARDEDYQKIAGEAAEATAKAAMTGEEPQPLRDRLERLRRRFAEVERIDFFAAPEGPRTAGVLAALESALRGGPEPSREVAAVDLGAYRGRTWVTRPRPFVDRLASAWLIRRFIDPEATIRYADVPAEGEIAFDMRGTAGGQTFGQSFGHTGDLCTFETLCAAFQLDDPALAALGAIVHEIDLRDGRSAAPEVPGVERVLAGWAGAGWSDPELERQGTALFEGLYQAFRRGGR
jgi:hypothetical protein